MNLEENLGEFFTPGDPGVVTATIGTTPVVGEFRYASAEDLDIAGRVASFACATADLPSGSLFGMSVSIGTSVLRITSSRPDGMGISNLALELVSGTPPDQDVTWEDPDVLLSEEIGGTECEILGVTMQGLLDAPSSEDLEVIGSSPMVTVKSTPAIDAAPSGTPVRVGMRRYRAKTVRPDGTGFTQIPLEEGVTYGCHWYRAAVAVDVGVTLEEEYLHAGTLPAGTLLLLPDMAAINALLASGALTLVSSGSIADIFYYRVLGPVEYGTDFDTTYVPWFSLPVNHVIGLPDARWIESLVGGGDLEPLYQEG